MTGKSRARPWGGLLLLLSTGCGPDQGAPDKTATAKLPPVEVAAATNDKNPGVIKLPRAGAEQGLGSTRLRLDGSSRYVSLEPGPCKLLEQNIEEGGYWRRRCPGAAGYALETSESDLRQDIVVIAPGGSRSELNLSSVVAKGAFNSLGKVAEWRGRAPGNPRALIVRLSVPGDAAVGRHERSDLVVARLATPACVVAVVPRGPGQNEKARAIADGELPPCKGQPQ